ncbi:CTD small phosphatase-like protein 2 isoform X1 [Mangifera indica]|uniref:CTD small phosphatase-like protein 2 isoform X1 n=1 Tax=Mangifera indica TaxID=29780 RepID=UPI001CFA71FA|nr:CTD small phosphatase-like protein 2 isoform X1 [Mangifera indica]XP_044495101.1 CTD small phosphatase-like protein 2 isoform X1 [Mangifera indica]
MPSIKMKTKSSTSSVKERYGLRVCLKSCVICKHSSSHVKIAQQTAEFDACMENCHDVSSSMETSSLGFDCDVAIEQQELLDEKNSEFMMQPSISVNSETIERMESTHTCSSNIETIFSPALEPFEVFSEPNINYDAGNGKELDASELGADDSCDNGGSSDYQSCNVSDFFISDMIIAGLPIDGNSVDGAMTESNPLPDYKCAEPSMLFDVADQYMILPFLEDTATISCTSDFKLAEETTTDPDKASLYLAIGQMKSFNQESDINSDSDQAEHFDPQLFIKNLPELSDVVSNFRPTILPKESRRRKLVTLVLDLDETLVHSTLEHCDDADFTFSVFFNMKEHTVYVKQRPYLHTFLERVAEMFEVIIFTASQSIYAAQLLDILDPEGKFISRRVYRESCIFSDGTYTKDLTVLGVDLAKVAIIDNSPQVFRLQVNNGIPIKSWFDDPSDCSLISLLPFLENLADAEDVRPIIARTFGNKE